MSTTNIGGPNVSTATAEVVSTDAEPKTRGRKSKPVWKDPKDLEDKLVVELEAETFTFPEGYDPETHAPLKRGHFKKLWHYKMYQILEMDRRRALLFEEAKDLKNNGPRREAERKITKMRNQMDELLKKLGDGISAEQKAAIEAFHNATS